jgi:hypothetical protein
MNILSTANSAGVPMTISQTWLRKVRDGEWLQINGDIQEAREAYGFWAPLDLAFLQAVSDFANYGRMLFAVPFNTQNFSAYLAWTSGSPACSVGGTPPCTALQGEGGGNTPAQVFSAVQSAGNSSVAAASYSSVGIGYHNMIVSDTTAPTNPSGVVVQRPAPSTATVSWSASTDDVGVAGYHIFRNGAPLRDVFASPLQDTGLSPNTTYTYQVQAFDLAGNVSAAVPPVVRRRAAKH